MLKKTFVGVAAIAVMCFAAAPAQAQFGKLGKSLGKVAKDAGNAVGSGASDMATDAAANKMSDKIVNFMDQNNVVAEDTNEYTIRLASLVLPNYTSVDGMSLIYKVYVSSEANILALPNGQIRVYTGLMDLLNDDELLAVISTQIGHVANKDARNSLMKATSGDNTEKATSAQLEKMMSFSGDKLGSVINELIQVPYTDEQNKAADKYAFNLLQKNKSNTSGLVSALNKFSELESADAQVTDEEGELSAASKFINVNGNNSSRASLASSFN